MNDILFKDNNLLSITCIMNKSKNFFSIQQLYILILGILIQPSLLFAQNDLPASPQTIPAGSFIIPMDTIHQNIVPDGQAPFNLKAYGLINEFLQNGIPVKWVNKSGKGLNDIDFTAVAERFSPGFIEASSIDYSGGPFIVPDTVVPCGLSTSQIIQKYGNDVTVYRTVQPAVADIKYTVTHQPKIAVFNNGGNELIHTKILDAAGINDYDIMDAADIARLKHCYTFASEPHADVEEVSLEVIEGVKAFVLSGGNFLAQCHAIDTYENRGFFQTTGGVIDINTTVSHLYEHPDMSFLQIHGYLKENEGGSVHNWTLAAGSSWKPETYKIVSHQGSDTVIATGTHMIDPSLTGGNVFYLGGHDYSKGGKKKGALDLANLGRVNALRMYLNAAFIPSSNSNGAWARAGADAIAASCTDSVTLGCTLTGPPGSAFLWTPSEGLSCTNCPNPVARPENTTSYTVTVTNGCIATDTVVVEIPPSPEAKFSFDTVCSGLETSFTNQSLNADYFKWIFYDLDTTVFNNSIDTIVQYKFSSAGNFMVMLIAGKDSICADTISENIVVDPSPVININSPIICAGSKVMLEASGGDTYQWDDGATGFSREVKPDSTTSYHVTGVTTDGCASEGVAVVSVVPDIRGSVNTGNISCKGLDDGTATVQVTGGKSPFTYLWNTVPAQNTPEIKDLAPGNFMVVVTDSVGCRDTVLAEISEPELLSIFTRIRHVTCPGGNDGSANATVTGGILPYMITWNSIPVQTSETAENLPAGIYNVAVTDSNGCSTSDTNTINEPEPFNILSTVEDVKCHGGSDGTALVSVSGGSPEYSYYWSTSPVQTNQKAGDLTASDYTVIITDSAGCQDSTIVTITQPEPLMPILSVQQPDCIRNGLASLNVSGGTKPYSYQWNTEPIQTTASATDLNSGTYQVQIRDENQCVKDTMVTLYAPPLPVAGFAVGKACPGQPLALTDQSMILKGYQESQIVSWEWYMGNASTPFSNDKNPKYIFSEEGLYPLKLIVKSDKGCIDSTDTVAEVYPLPEVDFSFNGNNCVGSCISFEDLTLVKEGSISSWSWSFEDYGGVENTSNLSKPEYCYKQPGQYPVSLTVISNHGCSASLTRSDYIDIHPLPETDLGPDIKICNRGNNEVAVPLKAGKGTEFLWDPTGEITNIITVNTPGAYIVTVKNEWGCVSADSVIIKNVCPPEVHVGNAFSPDNDGINDYFTFYTTNVGNFQLLIFNRWGEIIFESRDKNHFWDGNYRMEPMPVGVYAWVLTYEGDSEEYLGPYKMKGSITVVR